MIKGASSYIGQRSYRIKGDFKVHAVKEAYAILVQRHDALRTVFNYQKDGKPVQVVLKEGATDVVYADLRTVGSNDLQSNMIREYKATDIERGFDLSCDMLFRVCIFQLADELFELVWTWHHIIVDGWSLGILHMEFAIVYDAIVFERAVSLPPAMPYREFIRYLELHQEEEAGQFWRNYLLGYEGVASLPKSYMQPDGPGYDPMEMLIPITGNINEGLYAFGRKHKVTLNTILQAIFGILLAKYNDRKDVVFGMVVSGRPAELEEVESIVGLFINTLPIRVRFNDDTSFLQLLAALKAHVLDMDPYQIIQLADIQSGNSGKQQLFDHLLIFENFPVPQADKNDGNTNGSGTGFSSLSFSDMAVFDHSHYDLGLLITADGNIDIKISFNTKVYSPEFVRLLGKNFVHLAGQVLAAPEKAVNRFSLLKPERLYAGDRDAYRPKNTLVEVLEQRVQTAGSSDALFFDGRRWPYQQLNERVNQVAHYLRDSCAVKPGDRVGLLLNRTDDLIVSQLAVLKAGGAYLPLDPEYPAERIRFILQDASPKVVITLTEHIMKLEDYEGTVFVTDIEAGQLTTSRENPLPVNHPDDLAYCLYTSGTTGMPKGSLIQHHSVVNLVAGLHDMLDIEDRSIRMAVVSPAVFDPFGQHLFLAILYGHCFYLVPDEIKKSSAIFDYFKSNEIDMIDGTPSYLRLLLELYPHNAVLPRYWILGGEVMPGQLALSLFEKFHNNSNRLVLLNGYGLTECSVASSFYKVDFEKAVKSEPLPIGKPLLNHEMYVLDEQLNFLPDGATGEIAIEGAGVGLGYLNRPELTAEKFVTLTSGERVFRTGDIGKFLPDGNLQCLGRKDRQIKIRGYRVELGEIESVLRKKEGIKDVLIVSREDTSGDKYMAAYYSTFGNEEIKDLKDHLERILPQYMVPAYFLHLVSFPLTSNGKPDHALLPDPMSQGEELVPIIEPATETERWLLQVWQEVLDKKRISVQDEFFTIGGQSLKAAQVIFRIQSEYLIPISITTLFVHSTIEALAREIDNHLERLKQANPAMSDQSLS